MARQPYIISLFASVPPSNQNGFDAHCASAVPTVWHAAGAAFGKDGGAMTAVDGPGLGSAKRAQAQGVVVDEQAHVGEANVPLHGRVKHVPRKAEDDAVDNMISGAACKR